MHFFNKINDVDIIITCSEHMAFLMTIYPEHENDEMWLKNKQNEKFPKWFQEKVLHSIFVYLH